MAYTDSSTDNYTAAAYTDGYTLTHSTPTGHSHGGGLPPAFHSGETGGQPNPAQLGASVQEYTGTGRITAHHAGHHGDPGSDLGEKKIKGDWMIIVTGAGLLDVSAGTVGLELLPPVDLCLCSQSIACPACLLLGGCVPWKGKGTDALCQASDSGVVFVNPLPMRGHGLAGEELASLAPLG